MAVELTAANYAATVEKSDKLVLLDVWAPWCQPCRAQEPILHEIEAAFEGKLTLVKLNADDEPDLASRLGVRGLPTLRLLYGGRVMFESLGVTAREKLTTAVDQALAAAGAAQ